MSQNQNETSMQQPGQSPEQQPLVYTWQQIEAMHKEKIYPDLVPGTIVTGFSSLEDFDQFDEVVNRYLRQDLPVSKAWYTKGLRTVAEPMQDLKDKQKLWQPLENLRVLVLDGDEEQEAKLEERRDPQVPPLTVAYIADCSSTGRGKLPGAVTLQRTYVIGLEGSKDNPDPNAQYIVFNRTKKIPSGEWATVQQRSKELGHLMVAAAISTAFQGGLPESKR